MTKDQFKNLVFHLRSFNVHAELDSETANSIRPFDPQLATLVQSVADAKLAIHGYIAKKFER